MGCCRQCVTMVTWCILATGVRPYPATEAPTITRHPHNTNVGAYGVVSFVCGALGNPAPELSWLRDGKRLSTNSQRYLVVSVPGGSVLRIEPIRERDDGRVFQCVAENLGGEAVSTQAQLLVYPEGEAPPGYPVFIEQPRVTVQEKGRDVIVSCEVTGYPDPTVTWYKDYVPLDLQDPRYEVMEYGLYIKSSELTDEGKYECVADNRIGMAFSYPGALYIRVRRVPPYFTEFPEGPVEVLPGGSVSLTCAAEGRPMPYVSWWRGDEQLTHEELVPLGINVLRLSDLQESANYSCMAASELGAPVAVVEVRVEQPFDI